VVTGKCSFLSEQIRMQLKENGVLELRAMLGNYNALQG